MKHLSNYVNESNEGLLAKWYPKMKKYIIAEIDTPRAKTHDMGFICHSYPSNEIIVLSFDDPEEIEWLTEYTDEENLKHREKFIEALRESVTGECIIDSSDEYDGDDTAWYRIW